MTRHLLPVELYCETCFNQYKCSYNTPKPKCESCCCRSVDDSSGLRDIIYVKSAYISKLCDVNREYVQNFKQGLIKRRVATIESLNVINDVAWKYKDECENIAYDWRNNINKRTFAQLCDLNDDCDKQINISIEDMYNQCICLG